MNGKNLERYLREIDPVDDGELGTWDESPASQAMLQRILASDHSPPTALPRRSRGRARLAVAGFSAAAVLATAAAFALTSRPTSDPLSVGCYERLDQNADTAIVSLVGTNLSPVAACAGRWTAAFGTPVPPSLVTCVVSGGGTGVFPDQADLPAEDACKSIGATLPAGGVQYAGLSAEQVRSLAADLQRRYARIAEEPECAGNLSLRAEAEAAVSALQATGWQVVDYTSPTQEWTFPDGSTQTVSVPTTANGQRCSEYSIDALNAEVILVNGWPELPNAAR
ncbi:MAG: hypothetical protein ACE14W_00535 [Candidatus Velamenicoccus archaeovorus]